MSLKHGSTSRFTRPPSSAGELVRYMHTLARFILIISGILITGCDVHYGVYRKAHISDFIDHKCIESSLNSIKEVSNIKYTLKSGDPSVTANSKEGYASHCYHYTIEGINGFVSVLTNNNGSQVTQFSSAINRPPPQKSIDTIRPTMDKIETEISSHCEIEDFSSLVEEICNKVECK